MFRTVNDQPTLWDSILAGDLVDGGVAPGGTRPAKAIRR